MNRQDARALKYRLAAIAVVCFAAIHPFWPGFPSPNEWPRVYQAMALVERGSLAVDAEVARFGGCEDLSTSGGRLFPNKAPGMLPLLIPAAALARCVAPEEHRLEVALFAGRLLAASLPALLGAVLVLRAVSASLGNGTGAVVVAWALATPWLTSGCVLFAHALAGTLLWGAARLALAEVAPKPRQLAAAGFLVSWGATVEYPTLLVGALLGGFAVRRWGWRASAMLLGAVPPLAALALYNWACFGAPWALSSGREVSPAFAALAKEGVFGVSLPTWEGLWVLLLSPERGLAVWAPLLLLGLLRLPRLAADFGCFAWVASWAMVLVMSGYPNAHGGWFAGPRYLVSVFPFLVWGTATTVTALGHLRLTRILSLTAAVWALPAVWLATTTFPFPPEDFPWAPVSFSWPLLGAGAAAPTWLPAAVFYPLVAALSLAAAALLLRTFAGTAKEKFWAVGLAAVFWASIATTPLPLGFRQHLELAVIQEVYLQQGGKGRLEAVRALAQTPAQQAQVDSWLQVRDRAGADLRLP